MRVVVISTPTFSFGSQGLLGYGGLEHLAWQIAKGLAERGHVVSLIAPDGSTCPGVNVVHCGPARRLNEEQFYGGWKAPWVRPDGVIEERTWPGYWHLLKKVESGNDNPPDCVIDHTWQAWAFVGKAEGVITCPVLKVCHAPVDTMFAQMPPVDKPCFVGISEDMAAHFKVLWNREMKVCHNGIDLDWYKPLGIPRSERFLFLARFSSIKGADLAIDACLKCGAGLDLVGDTTITNEPDHFNACKRKCDGKQIRMVGPATRGNCVWWMSQAHALLHPNLRFREPFGLAPVEAMACGAPVLAFDWGAMRETVVQNETGCLVKTVEQFNEVVKVWAGPIKQETRDACRMNALRWSEKRMIDRYEELCKEAVNSGGW